MNGERANGTGAREEKRWWLPPLLAAGLIVVALAVLLLGQLGAADDLEQGSGLVLGGPTAEEAYRPAAELAEQYWPDAELAIVSGHWEGVGNSGGAESDWSFHFFSPSAQRLILIAVSGGEAWLVRDALSPYQVPMFSRRDWRVDSDEAIEIWWDRGGRALVEQRPDSDLVAQLRVSAEYGDQLVWVIGGLASGREDPLMTVISGVDGKPVEQE